MEQFDLSSGWTGVALALAVGLAYKAPVILEKIAPGFVQSWRERWVRKEDVLQEQNQQLQKQNQQVMQERVGDKDGQIEDLTKERDYWRDYTLRLLGGEAPKNVRTEMRHHVTRGSLHGVSLDELSDQEEDDASSDTAE